MLCDFAKPRDERVTYFDREEPIKVSYHSVKFSFRTDCDSGDIVVFVCHLILQDHVIIIINDFMIRRPLRYVSILLGFAAIGSVAMKIQKL